MHYFFLFAPRFTDWPLALIEEISARDPQARFSGLVTDTRQLLEQVKRRASCEFVFLDHLDTLERSWIETPVSEKAVQDLEARYDPVDLQRVVIGDRHVGAGYLSGADLPQTPLLRHCRTTQGVQQYLVGIFRWIEQRFGSDDRPDVALLYAIASSHQVAVALGCQKFGVQMRTLPQTKVAGGVSLCAEVRMHNACIVDLLRREAREPGFLSAHMPAAKDYLENFRSTLSQIPYEEALRRKYLAKLTLAAIAREALASNVRWLRSLRAVERPSIRKVHPYRLSAHKIRYMWRGRSLIRNENQFLTMSSLQPREYVYFPLHVDPEASTMVKTPMLTDQAVIIESLAKALPPSLTLVVKEHVIMLGQRPPAFYELLRAMPNVQIMSPFVSGAALAQQAAAIATITGTTGLEALFLGVPLLLFGDAEYAFVGEGLIRCSDPAQLPDAVEKLLALSPASDAALIRYIAAAMASSLPMRYADIWGEVSAETIAGNPGLQAIADGLMQAARDKPVGHITDLAAENPEISL